MRSVKSVRDERAIFEDLAELCSSPGYAHAIAYFCWRDNTISYSVEMKAADIQSLYTESRLIRTEISTLIGLMLKNPIDLTLPTPPVLERYIKSTEALLEEIHRGMSAPFWLDIDSSKLAEKDFNPFRNGAALRESIFYSAESAYPFQYRDFSPAKYQNDDPWLIRNKGFSIHVACEVILAISRLFDEKANGVMADMCGSAIDSRTFLPGNLFTAHEIAKYGQIDCEIVEKVLSAFAVPTGSSNEKFKALHDFNVTNAYPLIRMPDDTYLLFQIHGLVEALYETPSHWVRKDKDYSGIASKNRGVFTEQFAVDRLQQVFGTENVFANVDIYESNARKTKLGEIDVLVLFGNRAIVVQAKSKGLTLEARKGNDLLIRDDFKKSIQDANDQAYRCSILIEQGNSVFTDACGSTVKLPKILKRIYTVCLISSHYPALNFQARQFLKFTSTSMISAPFVMDIFALDAMTEMLSSPLYFMSYVDRRTGYSDQLMASHELTILSFHLKKNLWLDDDCDMLMLADDISADLDLAMFVRREGIPGQSTPEGILTRFKQTALGRMVNAIEAQPEPAVIDLGFTLLTLNENTVLKVSYLIEELAKRCIADGMNHDLTVGLGFGGTGLTIHCNDNPISVAGPELQRHCHARKYTEHAESWFGVCLRPVDQSLRFGINLEFPWLQDDNMDKLTEQMSTSKKVTALQQKVGHNDPCTCGSGKKHKKCCLQ